MKHVPLIETDEYNDNQLDELRQNLYDKLNRYSEYRRATWELFPKYGYDACNETLGDFMWYICDET